MILLAAVNEKSSSYSMYASVCGFLYVWRFIRSDHGHHTAPMFRKPGDSVLRALDGGVPHGYQLRNVPFRISRLQAVKVVVDTLRTIGGHRPLQNNPQHKPRITIMPVRFKTVE